MWFIHIYWGHKDWIQLGEEEIMIYTFTAVAAYATAPAVYTTAEAAYDTAIAAYTDMLSTALDLFSFAELSLTTGNLGN